VAGHATVASARTRRRVARLLLAAPGTPVRCGSCTCPGEVLGVFAVSERRRASGTASSNTVGLVLALVDRPRANLAELPDYSFSGLGGHAVRVHVDPAPVLTASSALRSWRFLWTACPPFLPASRPLAESYSYAAPRRWASLPP